MATLYLMALLVVKVIAWFSAIFFDYLFEGVIINYVPAYLFVSEYWAFIILVWVLGFYTINHFFGDDLPPQTLGGFN